MSAVFRLGLVPVAAAVLTYAGSFGHGFIWDDPLVLEQLRAFRSARDLLVTPDPVPKFYYRPFIFLTFLIDRALGGEKPFWFHATVIAWHAVVSGLLFLLVREVLAGGAMNAGSPLTAKTSEATRVTRMPPQSRDSLACLAATLFAVHPIHVESVAWIAGRSDVIATAWLLVTLLLAARTRVAWTAVAAGASFFLGLCSKEMVVAGLLLVPLWDLAREGRLHGTRYLPLGAAAALYFALRHNSLGTVGGGMPANAGTSALVRDSVAAVGWYAWKILVPVDLNAYVPEVPADTVYVAGGALALVAFIAGAGTAIVRKRPLVAFFVVWFPLTLGPSLAVIFRRSASAQLAERYLYLPSVALSVLAAMLLHALQQRWPQAGKRARAAIAALIVLFAGRSLVRGEVWADEVAFWRDVAARSSAYMLPHRELGDAYMRRDQLDLAEQAMQAGLDKRGSPEDRVMLANNLGNLYFRRAKLDEAEQAFKAGLAIRPHPHLYSGLGRLAMRRAELAQGRGDQKAVVREVLAARDALRQAVTLNPRDDKSHALLGQVLLSLDDRAGAREHLRRSLEIQPAGPVADTTRRFLARVEGG